MPAKPRTHLSSPKLPQGTFSLSRELLPILGRSEWLLTNGLGGFAMGSASGIPERRYHGWLIAATRPPLGRILALHSCVEWLVVENGPNEPPGTRRFDLSAYRFAGGTISPGGQAHLDHFERTPTGCRWTYTIAELSGLEVRRDLSLATGANTVEAWYKVAEYSRRAWLEVRPLVALRDFHSLSRAGQDPETKTMLDLVEVRTPAGRLLLRAAGDSDTHFVHDPQWWRNFEYLKDLERGQDGVEDLFSPGVFVLPCSQEGYTGAVLRAWMPEPGSDAPFALERRTLSTGDKEAAEPPAPETPSGINSRQLEAVRQAAAQFVVRRLSITPGGPPLTSIIAGYPWFSDWGRDTFISMRGLLLTTGRFKEALEALAAFASLQRRGLIPNCFADGSGVPEYNTVDASLWFVHAACEYLRLSEDHEGFAAIRQACLNVIDAYRQGTDFDIRMDPADGLITAGNANTQLTWMDAKRNGIVFTPRHGKPVEINALWYSCLLELALAIEPDQPKRARELRQLAELAGKSFEPAFWNEDRGCLFDVLTPSGETSGARWAPNSQIRPNQIFAVSQPFSALKKDKQAAVLTGVRDHLLTPLGLRTLDRADPKYIHRFEGPLIERDAAYHNGTVWPWLIGPYCEAVLRVGAFSDAAKREVRKTIDPLLTEFMDRTTSPGPIHQLAEIYDAEPIDGLRRPEGCMAQAWSVGELLRILGML